MDISYGNKKIVRVMQNGEQKRPKPITQIDISIDGKSNNISGYQLLFKVANSAIAGIDINLDGMSLSFPTNKGESGDIRFLDSNGNQLDFWTESVIQGVARIWVKINDNLNTNPIISITAGGNDNNVCSGDNTFDFFDDFEGSSIDSNKWIIDNGTGFSVSSSKLTGTNTTGIIRSKTTFNSGVELITKTYTTTIPNNGFQALGFYVSTSNSIGILNHPTTAHIRNDNKWINGNKEISKNVDMYIRIKAVGTSISLQSITYSNQTIYESYANQTNTISNEAIAIGRRYDGTGFINQGYSNTWDYILAKKAVGTEPTFTIQS